MKGLSSAPSRLATAFVRRRVRGTVALAEGGIAGNAVIAAIDRLSFTLICAQRADATGGYSFQVPPAYAGLNRVMLVATSPDATLNAVVADRVTPESVID